MSTGFNCIIIRVVDDNFWYYLLQNWTCPVGAWDWREYATLYGPFNTEDEAVKHLTDTQANPGGSSTIEAASFKDLVYGYWEKVR